ncbi:MAG: CDP-glycerol glycerophosphotransferase family protein, partial [Candidatus Marinimicrobia bacterium]|nr:CDP-glycerol glycerophosphotransferase family protein [Candidatus Neomarinimicrobiota bacterium]
MLTDSSSVISEFLLLDKPVITYRNRSPEHHTLNFTEEALLQKMIYLSINEPEKTLQNGRRYINKMHPYRDGKSSVRVLQAVDTFLIKHHKKLKSKPLNLIRRLQCRLRLSYFKIR